MSRIKSSNRLALIPVLLLLHGLSIAAQPWDGFQVHGFLTQGYVKTSSNKFFGDSEDGSLDFRELGVNLAYEPESNVRFAGQLLSRMAGEGSSNRPTADFLLVDFDLPIHANKAVQFQIGRVKNPFGLFNETRDVAFTRPGVMLPQGIYFDKVRSLLRSSDGLGVSLLSFSNEFNVGLQLVVGDPLVDDNLEAAFLGNRYDGRLEPVGKSFVGRVSVSSANEKVVISTSLASARFKFEPHAYDPLKEGLVDLSAAVFSLRFNADKWSFTSEYLYEPVHWRNFQGSAYEERKVQSDAFYIQFEYTINSVSDLFVRLEGSYFDKHDRNGRRLQESTLGIIPANAAYSRIKAIGGRWRFSRDLLIVAEYQKHKGTYVLNNLENPLSEPRDPDWDLFAISFSYRF